MWHLNVDDFKPEPHELVWKSATAIMHTNIVSKFKIFFKFSKFGTGFPDFSDFWPNKMCFGARWRFCLVFMSNILPMCLPYWKCSTNSLWCSIKVDCTYLPVNMALALFHKHLSQKRNIFERGIGEIQFLFYCIAYCIAYWFRLESLGPIDP